MIPAMLSTLLVGSSVQDPFTSPQEGSPSDTLLFAGRQIIAQRPDPRLVAIGQREYELMHRGHPAGRLDFLLRGVRFGDAQIVLNGFVKQVGCLADHRYIFQKLVGVDVNINAAKFDFTVVFYARNEAAI